jgi:CubicO group peptidase (beta-lactamase class C family)
MTAVVHGWTADGFEPVADAFRENFASRGEVGAAFAATVDGEPVVDVWGGVSDVRRGRPWTRDTITVVFSGTKGFVAVCLLMLIERGQLDLDAPVARYWPEFAASGKADILVRHVVSHTTGVPGLRSPVALEDVLADTMMASLLAEQEPFWPAGSTICYHALTYGWLCGELVRRIDGRSIGRFLRDEVAEPLALSLWIGLPADIEQRVSTLYRTSGTEPPPTVTPGFEAAADAINANPPVFEGDHPWWNTAQFHAAEIPGAGAIGTARSIARLYGCLARGGEIDGVRLLRGDTIAHGRSELARGNDACFPWPLAFGVGFALQTEAQEFGPPEDAFGHCGYGGSVHGCWPSLRAGFSYVPNDLRDDTERSDTILAALVHCLR